MPVAVRDPDAAAGNPRGTSAVSRPLAVGAATLEVARIAGASREAARQPAIVMLHEGLGCVAMWRELPAALAAALGLDVVVYSREGYGRSSPVPAVARPLDYLREGGVRELIDLLDALALPDVILVGHSDGASIALACAAGAHAGRLRGVVAIAPHTFVEEVGLAQIRVARQQYESGALVAPLSRYHGENVEGAFWGWNGMWLDPAFTVAGLDGELAKLRVPVLAMQGRQDEYGTLRQLEVIAEQSGGPVEQVVLEECGHSPHRAQPAATEAAIVRFVNGLR